MQIQPTHWKLPGDLSRSPRFGALSIGFYGPLGERPRANLLYDPGASAPSARMVVILYDPTQKGMAVDEVHCNGKKMGTSKQVAELSRLYGENQLRPDELRHRLCDVLAGFFQEKIERLRIDGPGAANLPPPDLDTTGQDPEKVFFCKTKALSALELFREKLAIFPRAALALRDWGTVTFNQAFLNYAGYFMMTIHEDRLESAHPRGDEAPKDV